MAKKHQHILNLRAIAALVKEPANSNAYHRINLMFKGAEFAATPELLDEVEKIIKTEVAQTAKFLDKIRKSIQKDQAA